MNGSLVPGLHASPAGTTTMEAPQPQRQPQGEEGQGRPLKLVFIPYLAAGHMIPLCDVARLFASRGHHATILTTPSNVQILRKSNPLPTHLHIHTVDFPAQQVGLPDGVESLSAVTDVENSGKVYRATQLLREPFQNFVEQNPPDCLVADFLYPWAEDLANKLRIPRLSFNGFSLFAVCLMKTMYDAYPELLSDPDSVSVSVPFVIPGLPHHITMNAKPPKILAEFMVPLTGTLLKSYGLIVNNFAELDGEEYLEYYEKIIGHKAWHLGPVSLNRKFPEEKAERGQESVVSENECLSWLNSKEDNSVLYICFGSICYFPDNQLYEIACGIEASGHEFIWVVPEKKGKEEESAEEKEKWLPQGFEDRMKEKGMIIRGWAPQVLILGHPATGAFLTHCGWNSTVEAISAGLPMITWPTQADQLFNEKLITAVRKVGVRVGAGEWSPTAYAERGELVSRDHIEEAVGRVMDGGDEAIQIRRRAQEFGKKAREALQQDGSSHKNLTALIDELKRLRYCKST